MISPLRLKEMICLASFEDGKGEKDLRICQYSRADYVAKSLVSAFLAVTVGDILLIGLAGLLSMEVLEKAAYMTYSGRVIAVLLIFYIVTAALYLFAVWVQADRRYREAEERVRVYEERILKLVEFSDLEESGEMEAPET